MKVINKGKYTFLEYKIGKATFVFSTAENDVNYDFRSDENKEILQDIKQIFNLNNVGYLRQVHGIDISTYGDGMEQGDGIVTDRYNTAIGIFTADCVPILLYDIKNQICSAVHSGWRGTYSKISIEAIERMKQNYGTSMEDVYAIIGPHIGACCYEVGEEVIDLFRKDNLYNDVPIITNNKLDMTLCIKSQLESVGVDDKKIITADFCTYCTEKIKFHSYRKNRGTKGRMFSFVFVSEN